MYNKIKCRQINDTFNDKVDIATQTHGQWPPTFRSIIIRIIIFPGFFPLVTDHHPGIGVFHHFDRPLFSHIFYDFCIVTDIFLGISGKPYRALDYDVLAITDHREVTRPAADEIPAGLTLIPGTELDFLLPTQAVHLLGLGVSPDIADCWNPNGTPQQAIDSIRAGCWFSDLSSFKERVRDVHAGTRHEKEYLAACDLAELMLMEEEKCR